ncbi:MAG: hypothetical protein D6732_28610 [Methanobacteriota archaeon]|nr:MAG: hypothetical protein D6732_28610 [Euryarchaeota archaeon]
MKDSDCKDGQLVVRQTNNIIPNWTIHGVINDTEQNSDMFEWEAASIGNVEITSIFQDTATPIQDLGSFSVSLSLTIIKPTGEITEETGIWGSYMGFIGSPTVYNWKQTLQPVDVDFSKITVHERDLGNSSNSCWFPGSQYSKDLQVDGSSWTVKNGNIWEPDQVGWKEEAVIYYRQEALNGRVNLPCEGILSQVMEVVLPSGNITYIQNILKVVIEGQNLVGSGRAGQYVTGP